MKILLAMDTSPASQAALERTAARPWPEGSSFEVVSVVEPPHLWTPSEVAQTAAHRAEEVTTKAVALLQSRNFTASAFTVFGDPKTAILDRAKTIAAAFIIVGSHGVSTLKRILLGSVASTILRYAPCSVAIMRLNGAARKILLATDGSESSERAARSIAGRPWDAAAEVCVLSAVELMLPAARAYLEPPFIDDEYLETARADAMKRSQDAIAQAREILSATSLNVSESISVLVETPQTIIVNEAARWGADLIVLGSHGHRGLDRFLIGSVSEAVAMHAACSVEVIRG